MTAQQPHIPPSPDVADAMVRELHALEVLWPAVERLALTLPEPPSWLKVLGPWTRVEQGGRVWTRSPVRHDPYAPRIAVEKRGDSWHQHALGILRHDTRNEAMRAEDEFAGQQGWLCVGGPPPEEAPAPAPDPQPITPGPGRRVGQHRWAPWTLPAGLERCTECGLWRGRRKYVNAASLPYTALDTIEAGGGRTRAGRCPGGRRP
jgi:hypothetical protein